MNDPEILNSALADALNDQLAMRTTIILLADRNLRGTPAFRAAVREFRVISEEVRTLRAMIEND